MCQRRVLKVEARAVREPINFEVQALSSRFCCSSKNKDLPRFDTLTLKLAQESPEQRSHSPQHHVVRHASKELRVSLAISRSTPGNESALRADKFHSSRIEALPIRREQGRKLPLLSFPQELIEKIVAELGPQDQKAKKAARATCSRLRAAVNAGVSSVKVSFCLARQSREVSRESGVEGVTVVQVGSDMEGQTLTATLLPQLKKITVDVSNGERIGLWSAENLGKLGIQDACPECTVDVLADSAILHLGELQKVLVESGVLPRVKSLRQQSWGIQGASAHLGKDVEVRPRDITLGWGVRVEAGCNS